MILTEEEAGKRWCPHVRAIVGKLSADGKSEHAIQQATYNLIVDSDKGWWPGGIRCAASKCMMWRWREPEPAAKDEPPQGYCGLAGKPDGSR